jgi:hypothetical protein
MNDTMMTCDTFDARLADYLERALPLGEQRAADAHVSTCVRCAGLVRDLDELQTDARQLPELAPSRDLWDGIAARIEAPVIPLASGSRDVRWRRPVWLGAAAAALVVLTAGVTYRVAAWRLGSGSVSTVAVAPPPTGAGGIVRDSAPLAVPVRPESVATPLTPDTIPAGRVPPVPKSAASTYDAEIGRLRNVLADRRSELDPKTSAILDHNLQVIDGAIAESRAALARDPASRFLTDQLNNALEKKLEVLRTAALLPHRT